MLLDGLIIADDVNDLWQSAVGDATGLNEEESYEMLCMVLDLPDPDDIKFLGDCCGRLNLLWLTESAVVD